MNTLVNCQSRALDELLTAVGVVAHVRADTAVDTFCRRCVSALFSVLRSKLSYHDVRGHCVARSLCRKSSTRTLWVDPCQTQGGHRCAGAGPEHLAIAVAEHMCGLGGWGCNCCCSTWAWGPASARAKGSASRSCAVGESKGTRAAAAAAVAATNSAKSLRGEATRHAQTRSPT